MINKKINRIMIAGTNSGCGKTTVTCAILKALKNRGLKVAAFKCGPDYIDPMFHSEIIETNSRNIDLFLCGERQARYLFAKNSENTDVSVVEGVMGFYDGVGGNTGENSSWDISNKLGIPAVLVVNCKGASVSVAAMIKGYLDFDKNRIEAVVLNNVSKHMYKMYKETIENRLGIRVAGYMPFEPEAVIGSRHLGLVTAKEIGSLKQKTELLAAIAEETIDLDLLLDIANNAEHFDYEKIEVEQISDVRIAVAKDRAFCFYYQDSLELLEKMGAKLIYFSPTEDIRLTEDVDGLILGGGYPELYLEKLSKNAGMINSIRAAWREGMPIYAECGGFMYLGKSINSYAMTHIIEPGFEMTEKLQNFGYVTLTAKDNTMLLEHGESATAHEFHYSKNDSDSGSLTARKASGKTWETGYCKENVFALYPHIHFWGNIQMAARFIKKCEEYKK
ncbi:cobyrinate a,c-diamide synthase [Defluviitalea raffinosedens]|uniref:Cobyrinate a,c-diamide synthase n=2 Tax=Defluviitalea raffinosedens TaxID=1450156 RepID=A0A7C8LJ50_9FIRM|nr:MULTISPECIES: cobyrinate a,c-diamide synthase [Clostridia]KAE9628076.1 cobyrinate a,c-diamide synthase [Defluviitalea raffinosedens]